MTDRPETTLELSSLVGQDGVREGTDRDAVDGVRPSTVVEPPTAEALASVLAWCTAHRRSVVIRGGGTALSWGRRPAAIDVLLSTRALYRITRYEPGDLTVTVDAGITIEDLNRELARHRQWLPIDARAEGSTVGGVIASNDSGPLRHRYGAPRDQIIGIRLAMADGRLASAGGNVVKNVAGYDLGKLMAGSFGSLAAIVSATFKLAPVPAASTTLVLGFRDRAGVAGAAAEIAASQLDPLCVEVEARATASADPRRAFRLLVRFAGNAMAVDEQIGAAERLTATWAPIDGERLESEADLSLWRARTSALWTSSGALVKASWMPAALPTVLALVEDLVAGGVTDVELVGRAALGTGLLRVTGETAAVAAAVERLRARADTIGNVVLVRSDAAIKSRVDVWGLSPGTKAVSLLLKNALDPAGILNAARGPI